MVKIKGILSYDGTHYLGWQSTRAGPSIQGTVQILLKQLLNKNSIYIQGASRTDRGVHARGQVFDFIIEHLSFTLDDLKYRLNRLLPTDIKILDFFKVPDSFHASRDCLYKRYTYKLAYGSYLHPLERFNCWHFPCKVTVENLQSLVPLFLGTKNFASFENKSAQSSKNTICTLHGIDVEHCHDSSTINFSICANRFIYKMARNIVGTLLYAALGKISTQVITEAFSHHIDRSSLGITAHSKGLCLENIVY